MFFLRIFRIKKRHIETQSGSVRDIIYGTDGMCVVSLMRGLKMYVSTEHACVAC